ADGESRGGAEAVSGAAEDEVGGSRLASLLRHANAPPIMASAANAIVLLFIRTSGFDRLDPGAALDAEQVARIELVVAVDAARDRVGLGRPWPLEIERHLVAADEHLRELSGHDVLDLGARVGEQRRGVDQHRAAHGRLLRRDLELGRLLLLAILR